MIALSLIACDEDVSGGDTSEVVEVSEDVRLDWAECTRYECADRGLACFGHDCQPEPSGYYLCLFDDQCVWPRTCNDDGVCEGGE